MNTKLTLRLDRARIERAKRYAQRQGTSVSRLVAAYFDELPEEVGAVAETTQPIDLDKLKPSPQLQAVLDAWKDVDVPDDYDPKADYAAHLEEKYR